jgi:ubiquinone/menaquinone biosynthesis C-methylase UbiE
MAVETGDKKDLGLAALSGEPAAAESGDAEGTARRRRRRSMRVPSDDVPRPQSAPPVASESPSEPARAAADDDFDFDVDVEEASLEVPPPPPPRSAEPPPETEAAATTPNPIEDELPAEELPSDELVEIGNTPIRGVPAITDEPPAVAPRPAPPPPDELVVEEPHDEVVAALPSSRAEPEPPAVAAARATAAEADEELDGSALEEVSEEEAQPPVPAAAASSPPAPANAPRPRPPEKRPPPAPPAAVAAAAAALDKPKRRRTKAWFEEVFDEDYLRTLPFLTPKTTQREAAFLIEALGVKPGQQVLDVGCGYGRHAMEMAARGHAVVALDLSLPLLLRGADEAQRRGLSINFVHGDMREMSYDAQFDGAYCVFSTFGYFDDDTNKRTAQLFARALKPGGRLVLELLNRDYIISDLPTRVWWEGDGCVVLEEVDFNYFTSRLVSNRSIVFDDGRQIEQEISIRSYSLHEVGKLLHGAGFRVLSVSGGLAARGRFFGKDSRQIIVVAERRADSTPPRDSVPTPVSDSGTGKIDEGSQHVTPVKEPTSSSP